MKPVIAVIAVAALIAIRVTRVVIGTIGLQHELGIACAIIGAAAVLLFGFTWFIRIGAFMALVSLWRWPWFAALLFAAPRVVLMIPGLVSTVVAKWRHPRPLWRGVPSG
jgi:hypothetical protein